MVDYWLKFDHKIGEFYGVPKVEDYKILKVKVVAKDVDQETSDSFILGIENIPPMVLTSAVKPTPTGRAESNYEYVIDEKNFYDLDGDRITYEAVRPPNWVKFNPDMRKIEGKPT